MVNTEKEFKKFASTFSTAKDAIKFLETHDNLETMEYLNVCGYNDISQTFVDNIRVGFVTYMTKQIIQYGKLDLNHHIDVKNNHEFRELTKDLKSSYK